MKLNQDVLIKKFSEAKIYFSIKLDLTWKMKCLYSFHLAKLTYELFTKAYILVHVRKCGMTFLLY